MKITFDTDQINASEDPNGLGAILMLFLEQNGGHPYNGRKDKEFGWTPAPETPRGLQVALMGDAIYEGFIPTHIQHADTGLEALWFADGDLSLMFHVPGDAGFTISNSSGGASGRWSFDDLKDPRNDPAYDPWADHLPHYKHQA